MGYYMGNIHSVKFRASFLGALGIRHIPPRNYFKNLLFKSRIYPKYIRLELTHKCNLRCAMCPALLRTPDTGKRELELKEIKMIIDELSGYRDKPYISLSGGEPFLRPDIFDILRYLERGGMKYKVLTNATVLVPASLERLKSITPDIFQVSLDGPEEIHDKIRGYPGAFAKTMASVSYIKENTGLRVLFMCVINSINARHLKETVETAEGLGVDLCFSHLSFIGRERFASQKTIMKERFGCELDDSRLNDINTLHRLDTGELCGQISGIQGKKRKINIYFTQELSAEQISTYYSDTNDPVFSDACYYPWYGAKIDPYGEVSVCKDSYLGVGNIRGSSLAELYNNSRANKFRGYLRKSLLPLCLRCCWCGSGDSMSTVFGRFKGLT